MSNHAPRYHCYCFAPAPSEIFHAVAVCLADETRNRRPLMLSYTTPEQQPHRRVRVRLEGAAWSAPFGLDQVRRRTRTRTRIFFVVFF